MSDSPAFSDILRDASNLDDAELGKLREQLNEWLDGDNDTLTLILDRGEASALSYFVAFAALAHPSLTRHEDSMVTKVAQLDEDGFKMWQDSVGSANRTKLVAERN